MNKNQFFKPTVLYKEYMILDMIEKNSRVTQREISRTIGIAVSMVNDHLDEFEKEKLVKRIKHSTKHVEYLITKKGVERKKVLNIGYLSSAQQMYDSAKSNIEYYLEQIESKGFRNILLYGAGEVCEILVNTIKSSKSTLINVLAIIDDDRDKVGEFLVNVPIIRKEQINAFVHDGILISSYTHHKAIKQTLQMIDYPNNQVLEFFE